MTRVYVVTQENGSRIFSFIPTGTEYVQNQILITSVYKSKLTDSNKLLLQIITVVQI